MTKRGWTMTPKTGSGFAEELEKTRELGPDSREFFLSHIETPDPDFSDRLNALRKKKKLSRR
ncbi:MAG: hypothetical protein HY296_03085 [Thaumarchaeota archaeon]|nr:hypothetical protein [Nitrososphaerota archaeon]